MNTLVGKIFEDRKNSNRKVVIKDYRVSTNNIEVVTIEFLDGCGKKAGTVEDKFLKSFNKSWKEIDNDNIENKGGTLKMSVKVSTERIKKAVSDSSKGAGNNNLIPITQMIGIKSTGSELVLCTTDKSNDLKVIIDKVAGDDFDVTIQLETFAKLISKVTSDSVELSVDNDILVVNANGEYKIPLVSDEEGLVSFPDFKVLSEEDEKEILLSSIMSVYNVNKAALAKTLEEPCLTGYYLDDMAVTTNSSVITFNDVNVFGEPLLLSSQLMNLLTLNSSEKIKFRKKGSQLQFVTDNIIINSSELQGRESFPIEEVKGYLDEAFTSMCKVPKSVLLSVIDRLSLFIEPYDNNGANFSFGKDGITVSSRKSSSVEKIAYTESTDFEPFTCLVAIPLLKEQLQANPSDIIELYYGHDAAIKMVSGKVTQVVALLEDEEMATANE